MKHLVWLVVVAGCGTVSDKPVDASLADTLQPDVSPGSSRCDPAKSFGTPVAITELNSVSDDHVATLTADELTVLFASNRAGGPGGYDLYIATRPTRSAAWGAPSLLNGVNTAGHESRPMITADGLLLYAETNTLNPNDWDVSVATRANTQSSFSAFQREPVLNSADGDAAPTVLPDGSGIYFASTRVGARGFYRASRSGATWTAPTLVSGINLNTSSEDYPLISADDLTLYFASSRAGGMGGDEQQRFLCRTAAAVTLCRAAS